MRHAMRCCKTCNRGFVCVCEREKSRKRERQRRQLLGGASVGRCHRPLEELAPRALAFAMGTHERLGAGSAAAGGVGGRGVRRVRHRRRGRGGGMPVPDDAGGSGEAVGGGVRVEGRGRAGRGGGAADGGAEDERGGLRPGG